MTKDIVYTSGTIPSVNGTIPEGIEAQTVGHHQPYVVVLSTL